VPYLPSSKAFFVSPNIGSIPGIGGKNNAKTSWLSNFLSGPPYKGPWFPNSEKSSPPAMSNNISVSCAISLGFLSGSPLNTPSESVCASVKGSSPVTLSISFI